MASLPVGLKRGLKRRAIHGAINRHHASRWKSRAGVVRQLQKGPRDGLAGILWPQELGAEADPGGGFRIAGLVARMRCPRADSLGYALSHDRFLNRCTGD